MRNTGNTARPAEFQLFDALTKAGSGATQTVAATTVVRIDAEGAAWLMNRKERGWGESGYAYRSIWELARQWRLVWSATGRDQHSFYYEVQPFTKKAEA